MPRKPCKSTKDLFVYAHDNRSSILYLVTNMRNGKRYVGVTRQSLGQRMSMHRNASGNGKKSHTRFSRAIRKYGFDAFKAEIVSHHETFKEALSAEVAYIAEHYPEYNITRGGEGALGYRHPPDMIKRFSEQRKGRPGPWRGKVRPIETCEKMRIAKLAQPQRYWLGKKRSKETKDKISATKSGVPNLYRSELMAKTRVDNCRKASIDRRRHVICLTDEASFVSVTAAAEFYGFHKASISMVCNGKRTSLFGKKFVFANEDAQ